LPRNGRLDDFFLTSNRPDLKTRILRSQQDFVPMKTEEGLGRILPSCRQMFFVTRAMIKRSENAEPTLSAYKTFALPG